MNNIVKIFNELIQLKLSHQFGELLVDCKLIGRDYRFGDYRYDLLFVFGREYNNRGVQLRCVFETCNDLFDWVDLTIVHNLSIVIITKGKTQHYSYFELMDTICTIESYNFHIYHKHPKYKEYLQWKVDKMNEEQNREKYERQVYGNERRIHQQSETIKPRNKRFFIW